MGETPENSAVFDGLFKESLLKFRRVAIYFLPLP